MEERLIGADFMFVTHDQSPEVCHPGDAPFHLPASLVSSQLAAVLRRWFAAVGLVRADQLDAAFLQSHPQRIGVGGLVVDQTLRILAWPASTPRDRHAL